VIEARSPRQERRSFRSCQRRAATWTGAPACIQRYAGGVPRPAPLGDGGREIDPFAGTAADQRTHRLAAERNRPARIDVISASSYPLRPAAFVLIRAFTPTGRT